MFSDFFAWTSHAKRRKVLIGETEDGGSEVDCSRAHDHGDSSSAVEVGSGDGMGEIVSVSVAEDGEKIERVVRNVDLKSGGVRWEEFGGTSDLPDGDVVDLSDGDCDVDERQKIVGFR